MAFRPRVLPILIAIAAVSMTVKMGSVVEGLIDAGPTLGLAQAVAEETPAPQQEAQGLPAPSAPPSSAEAADAGNAAADANDGAETELESLQNVSLGELRLINDLAERRRTIEARERQLSDREALLQAAEQQLVVKQKELSRIKDEIEALLARYEKEETAEDEKLLQIYSTMKPKAAADIFNELDLNTLISVARGMQARKLAPILSGMNPQRAKELTEELAARGELPELPIN